ncbi:hypothetical protein RRG08_007645 [Elysia crispata]|uniref:Uncharacterized protein n=1 Tax=Elysia crispata TaxID=231223 RepID=A0AAE0Y3D3_9GAST|nr:hypothetical protein RRG08_007645 [Elysia crispata]
MQDFDLNPEVLTRCLRPEFKSNITAQVPPILAKLGTSLPEQTNLHLPVRGLFALWHLTHDLRATESFDACGVVATTGVCRKVVRDQLPGMTDRYGKLRGTADLAWSRVTDHQHVPLTPSNSVNAGCTASNVTQYVLITSGQLSHKHRYHDQGPAQAVQIVTEARSPRNSRCVQQTRTSIKV